MARKGRGRAHQRIPWRRLEKACCYLRIDWPLGLQHASWPKMSPEDWQGRKENGIWATSPLWLTSEACEINAEDVLVIPPNFPPTYQCSPGREKIYGLCKKREETVYDVRAPSWTEQLIILRTDAHKIVHWFICARVPTVHVCCGG